MKKSFFVAAFLIVAQHAIADAQLYEVTFRGENPVFVEINQGSMEIANVISKSQFTGKPRFDIKFYQTGNIINGAAILQSDKMLTAESGETKMLVPADPRPLKFMANMPVGVEIKLGLPDEETAADIKRIR